MITTNQMATLLLIGKFVIPPIIALLTTILTISLFKNQLKKMGEKISDRGPETDKKGLGKKFIIFASFPAVGCFAYLIFVNWIMGGIGVVLFLGFIGHAISSMQHRENVGIYQNGLITYGTFLFWKNVHAYTINTEKIVIHTDQGMQIDYLPSSRLFEVLEENGVKKI